MSFACPYLTPKAAGSIIAASLGGTESVETSTGKPPAGSHTEPEATPSAPGSVTASMDSMNNVVTTTTTVTAIASTVHQLIPAPSAAAAAAASAPSATAAAATIGGKVAPPAFSRLPPDGHEFPPNFSEPSATATATTTPTAVNGPPPASVTAMAIMNGGGPVTAPALAKSNDKHSSFNDDLPELPKSHPPPVPRKVLRSDLNPKSTPATTNNNGPELDTTFRKPPPFPSRSSSIAESMLTRKDLPGSYQSLQSVFEQRRRSVDVPDHQHHHQQSTGKPPAAPTAPGRITLVGSNWRKDEKSEKSVRDKIAMFSSAAADGEGSAVPAPAPGLIGGVRKYSKDFTKSSENLLGGAASKKPTVEAIETYATLRKKAHSVEHLDEVDKSAPLLGAPTHGGESTTHGGPTYKAKFSLETSKPVVLGKAYSVENLNPVQRGELGKTNGGMVGGVDNTKILSRTTSFSGYSNGNSLATIASPSSGVTNNSNNGNDERWKSSISNLLEQRKKSMSKLRGLVIPEKVPEAEVLADSRIIGLPIIKSKDSEIILSSGVIAKGPSPSDGGLSYSRKTSTLPTPAKSSLHSLASPSLKSPSITQEMTYKTVSRMQTSVAPSSDGKASESESELTFRKPLPPLPPAKPPRTSLVYPPKSGSSDCLRSTEDESDDSDSVLSSRVSSPPVSPVAPAPVEKYALTRTLSSETNTSITSSNSTLTSSSGSQASCSSVGSTPTVDISRKLSKSSSSEASMNRKNVLASAKCRSGRGDLKIEDVGYGVGGGAGKGGRYEDGDSTDGYEEEERRKSKSKPRNSLTSQTHAGYEPERKEPTHYKVVDTVDSIVDKVIKVASYVEVVSDLEEGSIAEDTVPSPMLVSVAAAAKPQVVAEKPITLPQKEQQVQPKVRSMAGQPKGAREEAPMSDLAKWVRHEAARSISHKESEVTTIGVVSRMEKKTPTPPSMTRTISEPAAPRTPAPVPVKRELRSSVETKKLNLAEIRKSFESKSANSTVIPTPVKQTARESPLAAPPTSTPIAPSAAPTGPPSTNAHATPKSHAVTTNSHDRFSSWDSLASSSSGVSSLQTNSLGLGQASSGGNPNCSGSSQTLQSTPSDYGSFSSLGSSHSLITPQDLQLIIEEADPPLATPEAFVVVLQRETPESSIGITLAGGSDYEAKEITIHKILTNSPADRDGRLRKGDRILSINGLSMRGLTHRESLSVLKTPRPEVVMVITRSKSLVLDTLTKLKRPSMGSLSSLAEKSELSGEYERKLKVQHKASRSLDLDHLDVASNEAESVFDGTASEDGLLSADDVSKCSSSNPNDNAPSYPVEVPEGCRMVEINKDGAGLGFSIEGGFDSPTGNKPLIIKKIFMGGAAEKSGLLRAGEEIVAINDASIAKMTRIQVWNMMKKLPNGNVRITLK
ncbi:AGAP011384-PA-like protein [Anopheles sinensis]|uniref:AGAP011384-PA-like protein n=1 Tax=Anopheles sinensis TaxID=74873 RepID=A0A084WBM6_ANOSI|nr:AGAP011384-PA-like protein [Anopheles sinensis]